MNERTPLFAGRSRKTSGQASSEGNTQHGLQTGDLRVRLASVLDELEAGDDGIDATVEILLRLLEDIDREAP
jgi:hypothetical protein